MTHSTLPMRASGPMRLLCAAALLFAGAVGAAAQCDLTIVPDTLIADYDGDPQAFCVDFDFTVALRSERFLDGVRQTRPAEGCEFDTLTYYPYFTFPYAGNNGPYDLVSWEANGQTFTGTFQDVDELVALLNGFDPAGVWINDGMTLNIVGGSDGNYGPLTVRHVGDGTERTVQPNNQRVATGTRVSVDGAGFHEYVIFDPVTDCRDTLIIGLRTELDDERIQIFTEFNSTSRQWCLDMQGFPGSIQPYTLCDDFEDGTLNVLGGNCFTYTPDAGQTGSDEICFEVCDDTPEPLGPVCRRTFVEVITRSPEAIVTDTIRTAMTQSDTTFCINAVLNIRGPYDRFELCDAPPAGFGASLDEFGCVTLLPDSDFVGEGIFCFLYCANGRCDTTIVIADVMSRCAMGIFASALDSIPNDGDPTPYCLPITAAELGDYTVQIDGVNYLGGYGECDFVDQFFYNYGPLYANGATGPYEVDFWTVGGNSFQATVADSTELESFMRQSDPAGNWRLTGPGLNIVGGDPNVSYGIMRVRNPRFGTSNDLFANPVPIAKGATIPLPPDGRYDITLTQNSDGCEDEITVVVGDVPDTEVRNLTVPVVADSASESTCLFAVLRDEVSLCGDVSNGDAAIDANACVVYTPDTGFLGNDSLCVVNCIVPDGTVCDTTFVVFEVRPLPDTVFVTNFGDSPFTSCGNLAFPGPYATPTFCGTTGPFQVGASAASGCIDIDPDDGVAGSGVICVEFCSANDPTVCQQVVFVVDHTPNCDPAIFTQDTVRLDPQPGTAIYCLADGADLSGFGVTVNGQPATVVPDPDCGTRTGGGGGTRDAYAYSTVIIPDGPYRIDAWDVNGNTLTGVAGNSLSEIATLMTAFDPDLNWTYDPDSLAIIATGATGNYSQLILFDLNTNGGAPPIALTTIQVADPNGGTFVPGTAIALPRPGLYDVMIEANDGSCGERQVLFRPQDTPPQVDTFRFDAFAGAVSGPFCLPVTELGSQPTSIASCGDPSVGAMTFPNLQCVDYAAPAGFSGSDTACVVICADNGLTCDTSIVIFNVIDQTICDDIVFEQAFTETTVDCDGLTTVCLPRVADEFFFYEVSVDQLQFAPATSCGADTVTIYSYADVAGGGQAGPYRVENYAINGETYTTPLPGIDDLVDSLNRWDPQGAWMQDASTSTIRGGVSGVNYETLVLRQIATDTINRLDPIFQLIENRVGVDIDTGLHQVVLRDTRTGCLDTVAVTLLCDPTQDCPEIEAPNGTSLTIADCDATGAFVVRTTTIDADGLAFTVGGVPVTATVDVGNRVATLQLPVGVSEVTVTDAVNDCTERFTVEVICDEDCVVATLPSQIGQGIDCLDATNEICLPLPAAALTGFSLTVDGQPYAGTYADCDVRERLVLDVSALTGGPYAIDSFTVEGRRFSTDIADVTTLADTLSQWDAFADWTYDAVAGTVAGGDADRRYSDLFITEIATGVQTIIAVEPDLVVNGAAITLDGNGPGSRTLVFDDGAGCTNQVTLTLGCVTNSTASDTITVGADTVFCVDLSELTGPVVSFANVCPDPDGAVSFDFDGTPGCVTATGGLPGSTTACLVACDAAGVCDTTFYTVFVIDDDAFVDAVNDTVRGVRGTAIVFSATANDTFDVLTSTSIVSEPTRGTASIDQSGVLTYVPNGDDCGFRDSLTYRICTGAVCDEATVFVRVRCGAVEVYNGFSPNGDGVNETFRIEGIGDFPDNTLHVYNRWGNEVFQADGYDNEWDGTWDGKRLIDGTYFYVLDLGDGSEECLTGWVQLNR